jgi:MGT family glycosyltransferase
MPHYGLLCPPAQGHLNPMMALGRVLRTRGHRVSFFQLPELRNQIEAHGFEFRSLGGSSDMGELAAALERLGAFTGLRALRFTIRCATRLARVVFEHAPAALRNAKIDVAVIDQNEPAGATVAEHLGLPFVSLAASLPLNREPDMPPPFTGWAYRNTAIARFRNALGYAVSDRLLAPLTATLNAQREKWCLPRLTGPDDSFSRLAQISTLPRSFDFPRRGLPESFQYVGPFIDRAKPCVDFPWSLLDGRPLVYASFGTLQNRRHELYRVVADACSDFTVQVVLTGCAGNPGPVPGRPVIVSYAPQLPLLAMAALVITHAGLNTVLDSLYAGLPMIAIPVTNDQPAIAARLARIGAGEVVPLHRLSVSRLREAISRVLQEPQYRHRAGLLRQEILAAGGVERAADIVESVSAAGAATASGSGGG